MADERLGEEGLKRLLEGMLRFEATIMESLAERRNGAYRIQVTTERGVVKVVRVMVEESV